LSESSITFTALLEEAYRLRAKNTLRDITTSTYGSLEKKDKMEVLEELIERAGDKPVDDTIEVNDIHKLKEIFGQK